MPAAKIIGPFGAKNSSEYGIGDLSPAGSHLGKPKGSYVPI